MRATTGWDRGIHVGLSALALGAALGAALADGPDPIDDQPIGSAHVDAGPFTPPDASSGSRCTSCHSVESAFSHPVGFAPSRSLPDLFPLENGHMTCATCHDTSDAQRHRSAGSHADPLLRSGLDGAAFCTQCHASSLGDVSDAHAQAVSRAHLIWPDTHRSHAARPAGRADAGALDTESAACMECHDGSLASDAGSAKRGPMLANMAQDHPIGIPYAPDPMHASGSGTLIPFNALDHRVRLFDGSVGCGSCHSVYSPHDHFLVMANDASGLCLSCHAHR